MSPAPPFYPPTTPSASCQCNTWCPLHKKTNKKNPLAHTSMVKIKKEVMKNPALIYTTVFVLRLISKYTHHKLIASVTWLSLQS